MAETHKFQFEENTSVHVWSAGLDLAAEAESSLAVLLNAEEFARARRFHFERDRRHFTAARGLLRLLVGRYLGADPAAVRFGYGPRGKPFVTSPGGTALRFNLSHSHGRALFAFASGREVGIDLEAGARLGDDWPGLVRRVFSARERGELFSLPAGRQRAAFLNGWTRKEAFLKATGLGLVDGLQSIEVTLDPSCAPVLLAAGETTGPLGRWTIHDLRRGEDYAAALVVEGDTRVARFECPPSPATL